MNWPIMIVGMLGSFLLIFFLAQGFGLDPNALPQAMVGDEAPAFSLVTLDDQPVSLEELKGAPVVLNFWASWCKPCLVEHPALMETATLYKPKGVAFLGILYGDSAPKARRFIAQYGSVYPTLLDPTQRSAIDYGVAGVPETYVLDANGLIVEKITGPIYPNVLRSILDGLL